MRASLSCTLLFVLLSGAFAADAAHAQEPQPVPAEWQTPAERAGFAATPGYDETIAFLRRLEERMPELRLFFYGTSAQGRPMPLVVVSKEKAFKAKEAQKLPKPIVLIQNGIHAGEIDGKDACLMILRDLALGRRRELLDAATLLVLPVYNVDGHERVSPYNRPNQDGPKEGMGFRTTASGLDLNRDHLKIASVEARALMALFNLWRPHLVVDDHVTDGIDLDWVLTWSRAEAPQAPAAVAAWLDAHLPAALAATERAGHRTGPYVGLKDWNDPAQGFSPSVGPPRFSTAYWPLRNRPAILVEMHSHKPYRQRVLANRDFLIALLAEIGKDPQALLRAVAEAEAATVALGRRDAAPSQAVVAWRESEAAEPVKLPVYDYTIAPSPVTGAPSVRYQRGKLREIEVPFTHTPEVAQAVARPRGYLVLPGWPQIEERLRGHGLTVERLLEPATVEAEALHVSAPKLAAGSYQGLTRVDEVTVERRAGRREVPAGALWVPADQPDFEVAVQLLEPEAPDSLLSWGLLSSVLEQKEYIDTQVLEDHAAEMLKDPKVAAEWRQALADPAFAGDPDARYRWWYRRTPFWDRTVGMLPYLRVTTAPALATRPWR